MRKAPRKYSSFTRRRRATRNSPGRPPARPGYRSAARPGMGRTHRGRETCRRRRPSRGSAQFGPTQRPAQLGNLPGVVHGVMHQAVQGEVLREAGTGRAVAVIDDRLVEHRRPARAGWPRPARRTRRTAPGDRVPRRRGRFGDRRPVTGRRVSGRSARPAGPALRAPSRSCAAPAARSNGAPGTGVADRCPPASTVQQRADVGGVPAGRRSSRGPAGRRGGRFSDMTVRPICHRFRASARHRLSRVGPPLGNGADSRGAPGLAPPLQPDGT